MPFHRGPGAEIVSWRGHREQGVDQCGQRCGQQQGRGDLEGSVAEEHRRRLGEVVDAVLLAQRYRLVVDRAVAPMGRAAPALVAAAAAPT